MKNTTQKHGKKPRWTPSPLEVMTTSLRVMLQSHPHCFGNDLPRLLGFVRSRSWKNLLQWADAQPSGYPHAEHGVDESLLVKRQFVALFKKFEFTPEESGFTPEKTAISSFLKAERRCARINLRFRGLRARWNRHAEVLSVARKYILRTIGEAPVLEDIYAACDFGGGASLGVHGDATNLGRKLLSDTWSCTPSALPYAKAALWQNHQIALLFSAERNGIACLDREVFSSFVDDKVQHTLVQHNKISFVPKTAKTHRAIAVEPLLNGFLQKGVDQVLRRFLNVRGIDLSDQGVNQERARLGSLDVPDPYATLDLSAASDSISLEIVRELLPPAWFTLLDQLRSPAYELNGEIHRYHKFCSMGNGFCFPLETLIFAAVCHAAYSVCHQRPDVTVYGDDIIVRQNIALYVVELLKHCGFTLNLEKSFIMGSFKESCGADWVQGQDITPVYQRKRVDSLTALINLHNSLYVNIFKKVRVYPELNEALLALVPESLRYVELHRPCQPSLRKVVRCNSRGHPFVTTKVVPAPLKPLNIGFLVEHDQFLASPHTCWDADTQSYVARGLWTSPVSDSELRHPLRDRVEYIAVLRGSSSQMPLSLRRKTRTRVALERHATVAERSVHSDRRFPPRD